VQEFFGPAGLVAQHPPTALFLTPVPEAASVMADGAQSFSFKLDWANHLIRERGDGIIADYDFETLRMGLEYRRGTPLGELYVGVPITHRGHGVLDDLIHTYHGWFDMPNYYRDNFAAYQYRYVIATREGPVYNGVGDVFGIGDTTVALKHPLFDRRGGEEALSVRGMVKAPTGDSDDALGSGNWDLGLGLLYQFHIERRTRAYMNVDYVFAGEPDWEDIGYQDSFVYMFGVEQALDKRTTLSGTYRVSRNPLRIGHDEADKDSQELVFAFNRRIKDNLVWHGGFSEDINPETAPDFLVLSHLVWEF
jgi:hypothetical protein